MWSENYSKQKKKKKENIITNLGTHQYLDSPRCPWEVTDVDAPPSAVYFGTSVRKFLPAGRDDQKIFPRFYDLILGRRVWSKSEQTILLLLFPQIPVASNSNHYSGVF